MTCHLRVLPGRCAVCRLAAHDSVLPWAMQGSFWQVLHTRLELTVVCPQHQVPTRVAHEPGWHVGIAQL